MAAESGRPLVFIPNDELGRRVGQAFSDQWQEQTGRLPIMAPFLNDNQRDVVAEATGVAASNRRKQQMERLLDLPLEFSPRRRQDISGVYIYADSITLPKSSLCWRFISAVICRFG